MSTFYFKKQKNNGFFEDVLGKRAGLEKRFKENKAEHVLVLGKEEHEKINRDFNLSRLFFIKVCFLLVIVILFFRIFYLQVIKGDYYKDLSNGNRLRIERIEAKRGVIYDDKMKVLAGNKANFVLYFTVADLTKDENERKKLLKDLGAILKNLNIDEAFNKISKIKSGSMESYQPLLIAENIDYEKAMLIYTKASNLPGVSLASRNQRQYDIKSPSLSHVLGYTSKINDKELASVSSDEYSKIDYIGKSGLEKIYEKELRGIYGKKQIEVDAMGREKRVVGEDSPTNGSNLVLSIDIEKQAKLEELLKVQLEKLNLKKGVAIVMNPNNGEIICLVSLPTFDNNLFAGGIKKDQYQALLEDPNRPLFARATSGEYPPGSTVKPIVLSAALQENIVNENTTFLSNGGLRINKWFFPDWKAGGHGITDAKKAIANSVNTYFYYVGGGYEDFNGLGADKIFKYFKIFHLGENTGVDLPNEASGFIPSRDWKFKQKGEKWYIGDTYHVAIGQGDLLATPLQIASYTSFFANGGTLYRPHLVKQILSGDDKLIKTIDKKVIDANFINKNNIDIVREGMRETIVSGSAKSLNLISVPVAGKTGTAQWSTKKKPHAWFTGFAPYDNPEMVITILIEEGEEGSRTAVGVVRDFLNFYFPKKDNTPTTTPTSTEETTTSTDKVINN